MNPKTRSRIIITSRYTDVGRYIGDERSLVELKHLDQEKSWELFSKLIKSSSENINERFLTKELGGIARKIVERCGGLPLAIVVAVGMLRQRRRSKLAWNEVLDILSTSTENNCSEILYLSYKDLPPDLRPFFLYFGLFPEEQEISESENLIQVLRRDVDGRVKRCRIHDCLRVLCINIAKKNSFFCRYQNRFHDTHTNSFSKLRRLTIEADEYSFSNSRTRKLRSLLYFSHSSQALIPNEIGNLSILTYLKLSGRFKRMPSSIENLKKLVTLDIQRAIFYCDLPKNILRMKYLKHLLMCDTCIFESKIENSKVGDVVSLPNIETLEGLPGIFLEAGSLEKLSNLRRLSISKISDQQIHVISGTTGILEKLQEL
ncbi:putative disease resistance protein At1g50180, partial [Olea europaea var. sylvestris]|uniref:putative disease resistance protein At1g50180 n=1 Tax=Olea europaea var. sylvestris TaxID=158386 RepID=UPI000C1D4942